MAEITIYLKNKDDINTPDALEFDNNKIINLKASNEVANYGFNPKDGNIYFLAIIDSKANYDSDNYDYYLYVANYSETLGSTTIVSGDSEGENDIEVDDGVILKKINSDEMFVKKGRDQIYKFEMIVGSHFNESDDTEIKLTFLLLKTLKDRPLRNKGIVEFAQKGVSIDSVVCKV